jgi:release factor glutamine methyltransferase
LAHALKRDRAFLFSHLDEKISKNIFAKFKKMVQRRGKREPVAHIVGYKYFYKLKFRVNKNVLIPRPESEQLVDLGLKHLTKNKRKKITVIDVGTGSGAIIVALAKNFKKARFIGTDNYSPVLTIEKKNSKEHKVK